MFETDWPKAARPSAVVSRSPAHPIPTSGEVGPGGVSAESSSHLQGRIRCLAGPVALERKGQTLR